VLLVPEQNRNIRFAVKPENRLGCGMCGRVKLSTDFSEIKVAFRIPPERPAPNFAPSWNVAPTDSLPIVRYDAKAGERSLDLMRWGLVPYWAKDMKIGFSTINAMAETVDTKPVFREARSTGGAASCRSITSTSGKRPGRRTSSHTPSRSPTAV
jgi:hypothetical protein